MAKAVKTNVLRRLDALKIDYETRTYDVSDENFDGKLIAAKVDLPAKMIFKTLVLVSGVKQYIVCVVPVESELDLKAVARAAGCKSVAMLPQKELLPLNLVRFFGKVISFSLVHLEKACWGMYVRPSDSLASTRFEQ